jgi:hypothetical protein
MKMSIDKSLLLATKFPNLFTPSSSNSRDKLTQANIVMEAIKQLVDLCGDDNS